jgi:hypothetical protein
LRADGHGADVPAKRGVMFTAVNILPVGAEIDEVHSCELSARSDEQPADRGKGWVFEGDGE